MTEVYSVSGSGVTEYQIWFSWPEGGDPAFGTLTDNGTPVALDQWVTVSSLSGLEFTGSATPGTDDIWLKAYNGVWSSSVAATITDQGIAAPVVAATHETVAYNQSIPLTEVYSVSGSGVTEYQIWFSWPEGGDPAFGTLTDNGTPVALDQWVTVSSLSGLEFTGSATPGTDDIWLKAYNGVWSPSVAATITDQGGQGTSSLSGGKFGDSTISDAGTIGDGSGHPAQDNASFGLASGVTLVNGAGTPTSSMFEDSTISDAGTIGDGSGHLAQNNASFGSLAGSVTPVNSAGTPTSGMFGDSTISDAGTIGDGSGHLAQNNASFWSLAGGGTLTPDTENTLEVTGSTTSPIDDALTGAGSAVSIGGGAMKLTADSAHDTFVFPPNFGQRAINNFEPHTATIPIDHTEVATIAAALVATHDDWHGNVPIGDAASDVITQHSIAIAQLHNFHI